MALRGGLDLDGRIVIKVQLGNDVRKMLIHNDDVTYDELVLMMQRIYKGTIKQDDELTIKYRDEDGDLITIFDSTDVSFAIQTCNRQLKLVLYVNGLERSFDDAEVGTIRKGLRNVRDLVNTLLDQIDAKDPARGRLEVNKQNEAGEATEEQASAVPTPVTSHLAVDSKEFDPLDIISSQTESIAGGDQTNQFGEVAKSFDQASLSDRQSVNQSPTPSVQSSFGNAFGINTSQQPTSSYQTPVQSMSVAPGMTAGQPMSAAQGMTVMSSGQSMPNAQSSSTAAYYTGATGSQQQYGTTSQIGPPVSGVTSAGMPPTSTQQPQQQQQFNYNQWNQQSQQQQYQQQPQAQQQTPGGQSSYAGYGMQPGQQGQQQPQQPPQPQQPQQPQQQNAYGQMPTGGYQGVSPGANPYSKPGAVRASYPKASGVYPQLAPTGQRPPFPPQQ
ncbi:protein TFG-like [Watersipora subatra]|uniref:protein TFG-like n=1 Tax=Watersipora subatra TaxID=2589382 RepID=UPI00355B7C14